MRRGRGRVGRALHHVERVAVLHSEIREALLVGEDAAAADESLARRGDGGDALEHDFEIGDSNLRAEGEGSGGGMRGRSRERFGGKRKGVEGARWRAEGNERARVGAGDGGGRTSLWIVSVCSSAGSC